MPPIVHGGIRIPKIEFTAKLVAAGGWVCLNFPKPASEKLGSRSRIPIRGTINGFPFRSSAFPKEGTHFILINKEVQAGANAGASDVVKVVLEIDTRPRIAQAPPDLRKALAKVSAAETAFDKLSYTHKKEYVNWINEAKREETRRRRIKRTVEALSKGK